MASFWKHVKQVIDKSDMLIEVLDARFMQESRNKELENKIQKANKVLLYVVNKSDLIEFKDAQKTKKILKPSVFISSRDHLGTTILKKKILELSKGREVTVGIVGYPNVGKSSLINALSGKGAARTSSQSGFTKGIQKIKVDNKIMVLDTPGVFPYKEKDQVRLAKIGAIDADHLKDPELVALELLEENIDEIKAHYRLESDEPDEMIDEIAILIGALKKGSLPDTERASRSMIKSIQKGDIEIKAQELV